MWRRYDAPIEDLWDACTDPDRISRWFIKPTGDPRPGGTFSLEDNASGEILHCEPPRLLTVTWCYPGRPVDEVELPFPSARTVAQCWGSNTPRLPMYSSPTIPRPARGASDPVGRRRSTTWPNTCAASSPTPLRLSGGSQRGRMRSSGAGVDMPGQPLSKPS